MQASAAAVAAWRSIRIASVEMPRRTRNAEFGASDAPVSTWSVRIASIRSLRPQTTPARTSLWPDRYFVADSMTRSAPSSRGRQRYGDANVLSTTYMRAVAMGDLGEGAMVGHDDRRVGDRLGVEDPGRRRGERRLDRVRVAHVDVRRRHPEPPQDVAEERPRRPIRGARRHDPIASRDERDHGRVDRRHARRQRVAGLGTLELRDRGRERGDRRVVDPAVGVARLLVGQDGAQPVGVVARERDRLVDRHRCRALVDARRAVGRPDRPRREAGSARSGAASRRGWESCSGMAGCYTESSVDPLTPMGKPMTRFRPPRFEAYIAWSALINSSSLVRPSSG